MRNLLIALGLAIAFAPPVTAAVPDAMVAGVRAAADNPATPLPSGVSALSYGDALELADRIGQTAISRLIQQQKTGSRELPSGFLSAIRFKSPGHFTNRPSGDR